MPGRRGVPQGRLSDRQPRRDVIRETSMETRRERQSSFLTIVPNRVPDRPFGGDMDGIGGSFGDELRSPARARHSQPDIVKNQQGDAAEIFRREEYDLGAERLGRFGEHHKRHHHPIHLGRPSIGRDENAHQPAPSLSQ